MLQDDSVQVAVFYARPLIPNNGSIPIEMGGGEGNLVRLIACHWNYELFGTNGNIQAFLGVALSSNPEHEAVPPPAFDVWQQHKALYARRVLVMEHIGILDSTVWSDTKIVPLYGLVRPRRQIMTWALIGEAGNFGIGLEVYYEPFGAPFTEREEVNRKFGKYRRS